jgi:hypothetical protein
VTFELLRIHPIHPSPFFLGTGFELPENLRDGCIHPVILAKMTLTFDFVTPCYKRPVRRTILILITFVASVSLSFAQGTPARIVRLSPTAVRELPANLARELQRRGCTIPQEQHSKRTNNVIKGEFAKRGQKDWAVLCSIKGISTILVFWNGSEKNPAPIAPTEDRIYIQAFRKDQFSFSRGITPAGRDFIRLHHDAYGGLTPPPIDHQGIKDAFIEKASVVWYFYKGQWLKLSGSD